MVSLFPSPPAQAPDQQPWRPGPSRSPHANQHPCRTTCNPWPPCHAIHASLASTKPIFQAPRLPQIREEKIQIFLTLVRHGKEEKQRETTLHKGKKRRTLGEGEEKKIIWLLFLVRIMIVLQIYLTPCLREN